MDKYDIQIRKLAFMLLPTFLRRPLLVAFLYAIVAPLSEIHTRFMRLRNETGYRMKYNGQICHLKAVLNDQFDPYKRRITIADQPGIANTMIVNRKDNYIPPVQSRTLNEKTVIYKRELTEEVTYDFYIHIPTKLADEIDKNNLRTIVNMYKLTSKRFNLIEI